MGPLKYQAALLRGRVARLQNSQVRGQLGVRVLLVLEEDLRHAHGRVDPDLGCGQVARAEGPATRARVQESRAASGEA